MTVAPDAQPAVPVELSAILNNCGASTPLDLGAGAFNVWGNSFPASALPEAGQRVSVDGIPFVFAPGNAGGLDNIRCAGQFLPIEPDEYDWMYVLAASERRAEDRVGLHFADGSVDVESLRVSDFWASTAAYGETLAFESPSMHYPHHVQPAVPARLWCQRIPVTRCAQLAGIRLPRNAAIHIFAISLTPRERAAPVRIETGNGGPRWYRDTMSCLQATWATILEAHGYRPLDVLGETWGFCCVPGDVRPEEFYFPTPGGDLAAALAPDQDVSCTWQLAHVHEGLEPLRDALRRGELPIAAVDNFHLPFRPAFGDVHAAHLLVVHAVDDAASTILVSDAMPPAFHGEIAIADFLRSWSSPNPADDQDAFFSASPIARRWLRIDIRSVETAHTPERLARALIRNSDGMRPGSSGAVLQGLWGVELWTAQLAQSAERGDAAALGDAYVLGWGMQAQSALHGELLRRRGSDFDLPELREAGRLVERVAGVWTGVRVTAAHGRTSPRRAAADLALHGRRLVRAYDEAADAVDEAIAAIDHSGART